MSGICAPYSQEFELEAVQQVRSGQAFGELPGLWAFLWPA